MSSEGVVGEAVLLLMGEEVVVWLLLRLGFLKTLHHHLSWDFYLGMFWAYLQKALVVEYLY